MLIEVKVLDYGLADFLPKNGQFSGFNGTIGYAAPEVLEGRDYTEKADVWSAASLFYEMICGVTPFAAND